MTVLQSFLNVLTCFHLVTPILLPFVSVYIMEMLLQYSTNAHFQITFGTTFLKELFNFYSHHFLFLISVLLLYIILRYAHSNTFFWILPSKFTFITWTYFVSVCWLGRVLVSQYAEAEFSGRKELQAKLLFWSTICSLIQVLLFEFIYQTWKISKTSVQSADGSILVGSDSEQDFMKLMSQQQSSQQSFVRQKRKNLNPQQPTLPLYSLPSPSNTFSHRNTVAPSQYLSKDKHNLFMQSENAPIMALLIHIAFLFNYVSYMQRPAVYQNIGTFSLSWIWSVEQFSIYLLLFIVYCIEFVNNYFSKRFKVLLVILWFIVFSGISLLNWASHYTISICSITIVLYWIIVQPLVYRIVLFLDTWYYKVLSILLFEAAFMAYCIRNVYFIVK